MVADDDAEALVEAGCDLSDDGRHQEAEVLFRRAVALGEDWAWFTSGTSCGPRGT